VALSMVTVTGQFEDPSSSPEGGTVTFTPVAMLAGTSTAQPVMVNFSSGPTVGPASITKRLDSSGSFTVSLVATDNAGANPSNWAYQVTAMLGGALPVQQFTCILPASPSSVDFWDLVPASVGQAVDAWPLTGGTLAGTLTLTGSPPMNIASGSAAGYVLTSDASGNAAWSPPVLVVKRAVQWATAGALPSNSYSSGVLTASSNGALAVDGGSPALNDRVLVKDESTTANNGIYTVTAAGSGAAKWSLTRASDMNLGTEVPGAFVFVEGGTANANSGWVVQGAGPFTLGATAISWVQFTGTGEITAGTGLTKSGSTLSLTTPVLIASGGTGQATRQAAINALTNTAGAVSGQVLGYDGTNASFVKDAGVTVKVAAPAGATATDTPNVTAAITRLTTALASGPATLLFQDGVYQIDSNSAVIRSPNTTTVAAGSNGAEPSTWVPGAAGTLTVASATGFPSSGQLWLAASGNTTALISYTGTTSTTFTGCLYLSGSPTGTLATGGSVTGVLSGFTIKGAGGTVIQQAPNRSALPNNTTGDLFIIADCLDFRVEGITFDGMRDTLSPITAVTAAITSGQPSVTVAAGQGAKFLTGQRLNLYGGAGSGEQAQQQTLTVGSVTAGGGSGGGDLVTFTANVTSNYSTVSGAILNDAFGPYGSAGAFLTYYAAGSPSTVAGLSLSGEDQQNGLHLINCQRFVISRVTARNVWTSPLKLGCGTGPQTSVLTNGCSDGIVTGCDLYHGYDQGVSIWISKYITVSGNYIDSPGWAGVSMTMSDLCTVTGNQIKNILYYYAGQAGGGVAVEGGGQNTISGNVITAPSGSTAAGGITIQGWPSSGRFGLSSSNSSWPTLSAFLAQGTTAGTSVQISSSSGMLAGGRYSIFDGYRTESVTVATVVDGTHVTFSETTKFGHASGLYISPRISEENTVTGNTIDLAGAGASVTGIFNRGSVRSLIQANTIRNWTNTGIDLGANSVFCPPGSSIGGDGGQVIGNILAGGATNLPLILAGVSHMRVEGNSVYGTPNSGSNRGIALLGVTDSVITGNNITGINGSDAIRLTQGGPSNVNCARVIVADNVCRRANGAGINAIDAASCVIRGNICGSNVTWGISLTGCTQCTVSGNVCNSNKSGGITLANDGSAAGCSACTVTGNITREDGTGVNVTTGATFTQPHGIVESGNSNNNLFTGNESDSNTSDQLTTAGAGSDVFANVISGALSGVPVVDNLSNVPNPLTARTNLGTSGSATMPSNATAETLPRYACTASSATPSSGLLYVQAITLPAGLLVSNITLCTGNAAKTGGTHGWYALLDSGLVVRAVTADQTDAATVWGANNTLYTLPVVTPYTTTYAGLWYLGVMVAQTSGTMPTWAYAGTYNDGLQTAPYISATSTGSLTTPPSTGTTMDSLTADTNKGFYGYTS
jgi:parallel beta-helix repeat protein